MSKWDIPKYNKKPVKEKEQSVCRVVPPLLARIPNIADWLFKSRKIRLSTRVSFDLKSAYRTITEMKRYNLQDNDEDPF